MIKFSGYTVTGSFVKGMDKIIDSIGIILGHSKGRRVYDKNFGNGIEDLLFETITDDMVNDIENILIDMISKERRVEFVVGSTKIDKNPDLNLVKIEFSVKYVGAQINLVYFRE